MSRKQAATASGHHSFHPVRDCFKVPLMILFLLKEYYIYRR